MSPTRLRVVFLGNDAWSVPPLEALASSSHDVALVATRGPRPGRRGGPDVPTPVAAAARTLGLPLDEVETVRSGEGLERISVAEPDVLVVVAYGEILPRSVLDVPALAAVNVHFSLLPSLRGASPVRTALLRGLEETGVTTIAMDEGLDTGDVLLRAAEPIRPDDDAGSLGERLARAGGRLLVETLDRLAEGSVVPTPQDGASATYAPKLVADDRRIDWSAPAHRVRDTVRAFAPAPGAWSTFRGSGVKVLRVDPVDAAGEPGVVVAVDRAGPVVATGDGAVRPASLAPAGRAAMDGTAFVNGYRPRVGERFE